MKVLLNWKGELLEAQLNDPIDISVPFSPSGLSAWYKAPMTAIPVRSDNFIGAVAEGGAVNFRDLNLNPHAHGTHTECRGHITTEIHSVNDIARFIFCPAQLITILPELKGNDRVITRALLDRQGALDNVEALIVRTSPHDSQFIHRNFSGSNFPYFDELAMRRIVELGVKHLLVDQPSVDKEEDGGKLIAHRVFWEGSERNNCTITELIQVNPEIKDGLYALNLQVAPIENDASPSRPVLFPLLRSRG